MKNRELKYVLFINVFESKDYFSSMYMKFAYKRSTEIDT